MKTPQTFVVEVKVEQIFQIHTTTQSKSDAVCRVQELVNESGARQSAVKYGMKVLDDLKICNVTLAPYERTVKLGRGETDLK